MTISDKIIHLRRQHGWTQDDLAERLDVSRQSVSKWEGGLASPGLDKVVELSRLFAVSTDYLLKDELETDETGQLIATSPAEPEPLPGEALRKVTMSEAREFLDVKAATAKPMALGVVLCILSPICLLFLTGVSQTRLFPYPEEWAVGAGLLVLFLFVIPAVAMFVSCGMKTSKFEYMEKEVFDTAHGVVQMVRERMEQDRELRARRNVLGICLCVASAVPTLVGAFTKSELLVMGGIVMTLVMVAIGVGLIILAGIPWGGYQMLLQEGDYAPERKSSLIQTVTGVYWCVITAGYLAYSFYTNAWDRSWIVWPVAGVAYGGLLAILLARQRKR